MKDHWKCIQHSGTMMVSSQERLYPTKTDDWSLPASSCTAWRGSTTLTSTTSSSMALKMIKATTRVVATRPRWLLHSQYQQLQKSQHYGERPTRFPGWQLLFPYWIRALPRTQNTRLSLISPEPFVEPRAPFRAHTFCQNRLAAKWSIHFMRRYLLWFNYFKQF